MDGWENLVYAESAPSSRFFTVANCFSDQTLLALKERWKEGHMLAEMKISTGGGYVMRAPDGSPMLTETGAVMRTRWQALWSPLVMAGNQQLSSARGADGTYSSPETREYISFLEQKLANPIEGDPAPETWTYDPESVHYSIGQVLWRLQHGNRQIPVGPELSHQAEMFHDSRALPFELRGFEGSEWIPVINDWKSAWRVHVAEMEAKWINESRKSCTAGGLMWRKAGTGELIGIDEAYVGDTCCWHATYGSPCYGPHPTEVGGPILSSPRKARNMNQPSGKGGRPPDSKPGRKRSASPSTRKMDNEATTRMMLGLA